MYCVNSDMITLEDALVLLKEWHRVRYELISDMHHGCEYLLRISSLCSETSS